DITFGPLFTPTLDERAELADLLYHWRPTAEQLQQLVTELSKEVSHTLVLLDDGSKTELSLHEVMIERFVRLLRLDAGPDRATEGTKAFASGGHTYWSPDVAQHHHYRGEGRVDQQRLEQQQSELAHLTTMLQDLRTFDFASPARS